jgi:AraC-like DNA-binding protein
LLLVYALVRCASLLRRETGFASSDAERAQRAIAEALNRHRVSWGRGRVDAALHRKSVGNLSVLFLRYGPAVTIQREEGDFYVVQAPIRGGARLETRDTTLDVNGRIGAVLSPGTRGVLDWSERCEQILVKVPTRVVEAVWRSLAGAPPRRLPEFTPALDLDSPAGAWFLHLVDCMLGDPQFSERGRGAVALAHRLEELFVLKLLLAQPHSGSDELSSVAHGPAPKAVRLAEDYMRARLQHQVSLVELAAQAHVSARTLNKVFRDFRHTSPIALFRALRLEAARRDLIAAPPGVQVADIALRWGFAHLGRFAAQYRRQFGESPSVTLRR